MFNSFGKIFRLTSFGESHGKVIGGIIDGIPSNITLNLNAVQTELNRRKPGQSSITSQRKEDDKIIFLSGIFKKTTTGAPIGFIIENNNQRPEDYKHLKDIYRPSHADFTYEKKYGIRDYKGGGRSSARTTASIVVAGAIAKQIIKDISITAYVNEIGDIKLSKDYRQLNFENIEKNIVRCPDLKLAKKMANKIEEVKKKGDTVGGQITCVIKNIDFGIGEPVFEKLQARLAYGMLNIPAVKGFEYGSGFSATKMKGSEHNDIFYPDGKTKTNYSGGIQGGISNGMDIYFKIAFKPVASLMKSQQTIDKNNNIVELKGKGRHDACIVPRAVPIVEALSYMIILDMIMLNKAKKF